MKNPILYCVGKIITAIGSYISQIGSNIEWYGRGMWETNCTCVMCEEHKKWSNK